MSEYPRIQHPPCPHCRSLQTIATHDTDDRVKFYCPDCRGWWERRPSNPEAEEQSVAS